MIVDICCEANIVNQNEISFKLKSNVFNNKLLTSIIEANGVVKTAAVMGVSYNTLRSITEGKSYPKIESLLQLASEHGLQVVDFFSSSDLAELKQRYKEVDRVSMHFLRQAREDLASWNPTNTEDVILKMKIKSNLDNAMTATLGKASDKQSTN
jgi:transcriptional regulator with XRE-family HTH domain